MKNSGFFLALLTFSLLISLQAKAVTENLQASFYYAAFHSPSSGPFLETYMTIIGKSAVFTKVDDFNQQAQVEITYIFRQAGVIKKFEKINLESPRTLLSDTIYPNFVDIRRIPLENGIYDMEVKVKDLLSGKEGFTTNAQFKIDFQDSQIALSGLEWIEKYEPSVQESVLSKSGMDFTPYVSNFFPENIAQLTFYQEVYHLSQLLSEGEQLLLRYYLASANTGYELRDFYKTQKISAKEVNVILGKLDISSLPSGNYYLVVELVNKQNEVVTSARHFIQRSNPSVELKLTDVSSIDIQGSFASRIMQMDSMKYCLDAISPISTQSEIQYAENVAKSNDLLHMQQFFYNFWLTRNASFPEQEWLGYANILRLVNDKYGTQTSKGYKTDRGRIYLKYGSPNVMVEEKDLRDSYPFEIWQYYELDGQKNVRFLFYNPHRAWRTYELLHSTHQSELKNDNWLISLYDYYTPLSQIDNMKYDIKNLKKTDFGIRVLTLWENP